MFDFDKIIERQSDKCRKWDHTFVCSRFGDVPESFIPLVDSRYGFHLTTCGD